MEWEMLPWPALENIFCSSLHISPPRGPLEDGPATGEAQGTGGLSRRWLCTRQHTRPSDPASVTGGLLEARPGPLDLLGGVPTESRMCTRQRSAPRGSE